MNLIRFILICVLIGFTCQAQAETQFLLNIKTPAQNLSITGESHIPLLYMDNPFLLEVYASDKALVPPIYSRYLAFYRLSNGVKTPFGLGDFETSYQGTAPNFNLAGEQLSFLVSNASCKSGQTTIDRVSVKDFSIGSPIPDPFSVGDTTTGVTSLEMTFSKYCDSTTNQPIAEGSVFLGEVSCNCSDLQTENELLNNEKLSLQSKVKNLQTALTSYKAKSALISSDILIAMSRIKLAANKCMDRSCTTNLLLALSALEEAAARSNLIIKNM